MWTLSGRFEAHAGLTMAFDISNFPTYGNGVMQHLARQGEVHDENCGDDACTA